MGLRGQRGGVGLSDGPLHKPVVAGQAPDEASHPLLHVCCQVRASVGPREPQRQGLQERRLVRQRGGAVAEDGLNLAVAGSKEGKRGPAAGGPEGRGWQLGAGPPSRGDEFGRSDEVVEQPRERRGRVHAWVLLNTPNDQQRSDQAARQGWLLQGRAVRRRQRGTVARVGMDAHQDAAPHGIGVVVVVEPPRHGRRLEVGKPHVDRLEGRCRLPWRHLTRGGEETDHPAGDVLQGQTAGHEERVRGLDCRLDHRWTQQEGRVREHEPGEALRAEEEGLSESLQVPALKEEGPHGQPRAEQPVSDGARLRQSRAERRAIHGARKDRA